MKKIFLLIYLLFFMSPNAFAEQSLDWCGSSQKSQDFFSALYKKGKIPAVKEYLNKTLKQFPLTIKTCAAETLIMDTIFVNLVTLDANNKHKTEGEWGDSNYNGKTGAQTLTITPSNDPKDTFYLMFWYKQKS